jgi:ribose/xylose/arabinose/galactoside ABC-type transport system permease subunit
MTKQSINAMRIVLLVPIVLLLGLTALLYFRTGKFDLSSVVGAGLCLVIFLVTKPKQVSGGSN